MLSTSRFRCLVPPTRGTPSQHTQYPWGILPAETSEVMHGLSKSGNRRGGSRTLRRPQEAIRLQPEAWEVVRPLNATEHAGRTESRARRRPRRGAPPSWRGGQKLASYRATSTRASRRRPSWLGSESELGVRGRREGKKGGRAVGLGMRRGVRGGKQGRTQSWAAATATSLYIRKITAAAPPDATNGGAGSGRAGPRAGRL